MTDETIYKNLSQLGAKTPLPESPEKAVLERVENPHPGVDYAIRFTCPEFTSLCPITSAPDFAHLVIDYVPNRFILESKSLKLFLGSYRNHGAFHEDCTVGIGKRIIEEVEPIWLRIAGFWFPRGGIPIDIFFQNTEAPKGVWIPPLDAPRYQGR